MNFFLIFNFFLKVLASCVLCLPEIFQQNRDNAFHLLSLPDGSFSASVHKRECLRFGSKFILLLGGTQGTVVRDGC